MSSWAITSSGHNDDDVIIDKAFESEEAKSPIERWGSRSRLSIQSSLHHGTLGSSVLIFMSSVLGATILVVPWAVARCGWALGVAVIIICGLITLLGASVLLECARLITSQVSQQMPTFESQDTGIVSVMSPASVTFSAISREVTPRLSQLPEVVVILDNLGGCAGALWVSADLVPRVLHTIAVNMDYHGFEQGSLGEIINNQSMWITVVAATVSPLCFFKDLTRLEFAGYITAVATVYVVGLLVVMYAFPSIGACQGTVSAHHHCTIETVAVAQDNLPFSLFEAIPVFLSAFALNFQVLPVYNTLAKPSTKTVRKAVGMCLSFGAAVYAVAGLAAYLTFGSKLPTNVLDGKVHTIPVGVARFLMVMSMALVFPLVIFSTRESCKSIFQAVHLTHRISEGRLFVGTTVLLILISYGVAMGATDLDAILAIMGAVTTIPIMLTMPGVYLALLARKGRRGVGFEAVGWATFLLGLFLSTFSLVGLYFSSQE